MVGRIQRNKARSIAGWAYAAHSVDSAQADRPRWTARRRDALDDGRRAEPLRVYHPAQPRRRRERGGVDIDRPDLVDELCAAAHAATGLEFVGLMAIPPLDEDPDEAFARVNAEHQRVQARLPATPRAVGGHVRTISSRRSNTARHVCVSVPRYWGNVL